MDKSILNTTNIHMNILETYTRIGILRKIKHKSFPILLFTITEKVYVEDFWNYITIICNNGIVTDFNGNIISYSLKKLFNEQEYNDINHRKSHLNYSINKTIAKNYFTLFFYINSWKIFTDESFESNQIYKIKECLNIEYPSFTMLPKMLTHVFEINKDNNSGEINKITYIISHDNTGKEITLPSYDVFLYGFDSYSNFANIIDKKEEEKLKRINDHLTIKYLNI